MLELRPNCECCDKDLPANTGLAYICSFECTFCADCSEHYLQLTCPTAAANWSGVPAAHGQAGEQSGFHQANIQSSPEKQER